MNSYTVALQPHYRGWSAQPLTEEVIARSLEGVILRQLEADAYGRVVLDLELRRPTHVDALNEIAFAVQDMGYSIVQATVTEWTNSVVEGILLGAVGGGGGTGAATRNSGFACLAMVIGAIAGGVAGSAVHRKRVVFDVSRTYAGWQFTPVQPEATYAFRPRLA